MQIFILMQLHRGTHSVFPQRRESYLGNPRRPVPAVNWANAEARPQTSPQQRTYQEQPRQHSSSGLGSVERVRMKQGQFRAPLIPRAVGVTCSFQGCLDWVRPGIIPHDGGEYLSHLSLLFSSLHLHPLLGFITLAIVFIIPLARFVLKDSQEPLFCKRTAKDAFLRR